MLPVYFTAIGRYKKPDHLFASGYFDVVESVFATYKHTKMQKAVLDAIIEWTRELKWMAEFKTLLKEYDGFDEMFRDKLRAWRLEEFFDDEDQVRSGKSGRWRRGR